MRRLLSLLVLPALAGALQFSTDRLAPVGDEQRVVAALEVLSPILSTTSTTMAPPATTAPRPPKRPSRGAAVRELGRAVALGGHACGGDLPPCWVMLRESHGDPRAVNWHGCSGRGCFGKWQFDPLTWARFDGTDRPDLAPEDVQDSKARQLWNGGRGCGHWAAC